MIDFMACGFLFAESNTKGVFSPKKFLALATVALSFVFVN
jgi:hypothetical protein